MSGIFSLKYQMFAFTFFVFSVQNVQLKCSDGNSFDQPMILTTMIEAGDLQEAFQSSRVNPLGYNIESYAGFFTVNVTYNSNLFFWFFPASQNHETAPVVLWLMGGPGTSSLVSLFKENGPYEINEDLELGLRESSWTKLHSVIYIDNPVGTGFSFTDSEGGYSTNQQEISANLYSALIQFFTLFSQYQRNDFFIAGVSYAGKYVPSLSYVIHENNPTSEVKINLRGVAFGNGVVDLTMINYGDFLYQIGLVDSLGKKQFHDMEQEFVKLVQKEHWLEALDVFNGIFYDEFSLFRNLTGYSFSYNFLFTDDYRDFEIVSRFLCQDKVRKSLHTGNATFIRSSSMVEFYLRQDVLRYEKTWVEVILENYRVLLYSGQLDMLIPYTLTEQFVSSLVWRGSEEYNVAPRMQWYVGEDLAGYVKEGGNLTLILVRNAGHNVPVDQPEWALDIITRFTRNQPLYTKNIQNL